MGEAGLNEVGVLRDLGRQRTITRLDATLAIVSYP